MRTYYLAAGLFAVTWAQCGYVTSNCAGLSPNFAVDPPQPRCSNQLPLTVTLYPIGTGGATLTLYYRLNGVGGWSTISNLPARQHTFTPGQTGNHQFMMVVQGPGGCRDTVIHCYTITQRPTATITSINPAAPRCADELPITLHLSAAYQPSIVSYNWYIGSTLISSSGGTNVSVPNAIITPGTHTIKLVVIDTSGCRDSALSSYVVSPTPSAGFIPSTFSICRGGKVCFTNTSSGISTGTTYTWNFGDGGTSNVSNPCHQYNNAGTYTVTLQMCNPGGCCHTASQTITVIPGGLADILGDGVQDTVRYCVSPGDPTTTFTVNFTSNSSCPGGGCTYTWDFGYDGATFTTLADTPQTHTYTSFGEGWAYLTVTHPGGCVHKDSVYVVFQPILVAAAFDIPAMAGGCVPYTITIQNISQSYATTFVWDYGDGQRDTVRPPSLAPFTHTYTATGTYQIRLDAFNACGSTFAIRGPIVVVGPPKITALTANPNPSCAPQLINFSVTATGVQPSNNIHWDFGDGSPIVSGTTTPTHLYAQLGQYEVMVRACNGCGCDTARITVTIDSLPKANLQASPLEGCHPLTVNFTNLSQPHMAGGITAPFWEALYIDGGQCCGPWWSSCACQCPQYVDDHDFFNFNGYCWGSYGCCQSSSTALPGLPMNIPSVTFTHTNSNSIRTYNVLYIIGNRCGQDSQRYEIKVHPPVQARFTATPTAACVGTSVSFLNESWGDSLTFIWDWGDGSPFFYDTALAAAAEMPRTQTHTYTTPGTYTVTLYVTGYCGKDTLRRTLIVHPYPNPSIGVDTIESCQQGGGTSFTFTNTSASDPPGTTYSWSFPGGSPSSSTASTVSVIYSTPGTYTATLTANYNGCTQSTTQTITVHPRPPVSFTVMPISGCGPLSVTLTQTSPNLPGYTYVWDYGSGAPLDTTYIPVSPQVYTNSGNTTQIYTITLYVITDKGCIDSLKQSISVFPYPEASIGVSPASACLQGAGTTFTFSSTSAANPPGTTYTWSFPGGSPASSAGTSVSVTYTTPGTYTATLTAGYNGCIQSTTQTVTVLPGPSVDFTATPTSGCASVSVTLNQMSANVAGHLYVWDYGTGAPRDTSYLPASPQVYTNIGLAPQNYTVTLYVLTNDGCIDSLQRIITVYPNPVSNFGTSPTPACAGTPVVFMNNSSGATGYSWDFGDGSSAVTSPNPTHTYVMPGTYQVQLVALSAGGCSDTLRRTLSVEPRPTANFTYTIGCVGTPTTFTDASLAATAWQWDFGDGSPSSTLPNPTHTYAAAGTYTVRLIATAANGCTDTITKSVVVNSPPQPAFSASLTCVGQSTSFTDLTGGTPVGWLWDFGDGSPTSTLQNPTHTYAAAGTYAVKLVVIAGTGCTDSVTQTITVAPSPVAGFTATSVCAADQPVTFTNTSTGANTYQWDFGDGTPFSISFTPTHVYLTGGSYSVQLIAINAQGCRDTFVQSITVFPKPQITFQADTVCQGQATSFTANSTVPITGWQWDFGDGQGGSGAPATHTYGAAGVYTVQLIGQTAQGCRDTFVRQIMVSLTPTAAFSASTVCAGEATTFNNQSTGATSWLWDFGDGSPTSTQQHPTHTYAAAGTYTVTLIAYSGSGCSRSISQAVSVYLKPSANFIADTVCLGEPTTFTDQSTGAAQWLWDFGDSHGSSLPNPQHIYTQPGTYVATLIVTSAQGCRDTLRKTVIVHPRPTAGFTYDTACALRPQQFTDTSQGGVTFWLWDFGDGTQSPLQNPTHIYSAGGTYTVTLTVGNSVRCTDQVTMPVAVYTMPAVDFQADTVCIGRPTTFVNLSQDVVPLSYVWLFGDGNASFSQHPTYIYQAPGTYSVTLVVTNVHGCDTFITKPVVVAPVPQADFRVDTVCFGRATSFTDATQGLVEKWIWQWGDGTLDTVATPTIQHLYPAPGVYVVTMTALFGDCATSITKGVRVVDSVRAQILLSDTLICPGEAITALEASSGGAQWWLWDMGNGQTLTTQHALNIGYPNPGLYTIQLVAGNGYCTDTAKASLYVMGQPQALFSLQDVCAGQPLSLQNSSFPSALPVQWLWDFGNGDTSHSAQPTYTYTRPGTYTVTLILHNGRCGDTLRQQVTVWPNPVATIQVRDSITRILKETFFADLTAGTIVQREWDLGDGATSTRQEFSYMYADTGTYLVRLIVVDDKGCRDTAYQRVVVYGEFSMYIPTAFSPNGDGVNDVFYPGGVWFDVYDFLFQIYDRWGQLIWETRERGHAWDGRDLRTGQLVPEDAYVFRIRGMDFKGKHHEYVGTVTVLK